MAHWAISPRRSHGGWGWTPRQPSFRIIMLSARTHVGTSRPRRALRAGTAFTAFAVPALCIFNYVLNHYYEHGAYLLDTGWFAWMASNADAWPLPNPPLLGDTYFSTHVSLIFYLLTGLHRLISPIVELDAALWFALVQGCWAGLTGIAVHALLKNDAAGTGWELCRLTLAILASMNGIALAITAFPHIEAAIPALTLCFFALLLGGRPILAGIVLVLTLSVREDAGLHLFGLLLLVACVQWFRDRKACGDALPWQRYAALAACCLAWSVTAIVWQKTHYVGDNALVRIYLGEPAFAHLNAAFLVHRSGQLMAASLHVLVPMLFLILAGLVTRDGRLLAAPVSVLPWISLSVAAITYGAGTLANYYAFPIVTALLWPAVTYAMDAGQPERKYRYPVWLAAAALLSIVCFAQARVHAQDPAPWRSFDFAWLDLRQPTEAALDAFWRAPTEQTGIVLFDDSVTALRPDLVDHHAWLYADSFSESHARIADTVVYMPRGDYAEARDLMNGHGFNHACRYAHTHVTVRSKRALELSGCRPLVLP